MGKGWFTRGWPFARKKTEQSLRPVVGLVLSGGGARASFQIGALRYLYRETEITPKVMTGTSAGSILVCLLAQHSQRDDQADIVDQVERVWRGLRQQSDMFAERSWFTKARALAPELEAVLAPALTADQDAHPAKSKPVSLGRFPLFGGLPRTQEKPAEDQHFHPLLGFGPDPDEVSPGTAAWTPGAVLQLIGALPTLGRAGGDLPSIVRSAERSRAAYRPGPILRSLLDRKLFKPEQVATSGIDIRIGTVCLETGQLRYVRGDGVIVDRGDIPLPGEEPQDLIMAVLASCSIPAVFAPAPLGSSHYIDGGVRENVPVEACYNALGATEAYVIVSGPSGLSPAPKAAQGTIFDIMARAVAVLADEAARDEIAYARSIGATVIQPELDVHDLMTVDPGLIAINIDYGWMRAREVLAPAPELNALYRRLTLTRHRAWAVENVLFAPAEEQAPFSDAERDAAVNELATLKYELRDLLTSVPQECLPEGAANWWRTFEAHTFQTPKTAPWLPLTPP